MQESKRNDRWNGATQLKENLEVVLESVFEYLYQEREKCG